MKQQIYKNISWLFLDKIIRILGGVFIGIWIARYLGPNDFGILNYSIAYTSLFTLFVRFGMDQIVVREITKKPKLTHYFLGTAFILKLFGAFLGIISIYISLFFIEVDHLTKLVIFVICMGFLFQAFDIIDFFYQSKILSKYVVLARNTAFIISSLLKVFFILNENGVVYFALAATIDVALTGLFLLLIYGKTGGILTKWRFSKKIALQLIKYSWPIALSSFLISIHMRIDQVMIGNMLDSDQVGIYSVSVVLTDLSVLVPGVLVSTLMPYFVSLREENIKYYNYRLIQLYFFMFWFGVLVGLITVLFGENIIEVLYGKDYLHAYSALVINIWAGVFMAQSAAKGIWVISENKQIYRIIPNIIAVIVNIVLNLTLIPVYGITGAAIATLITKFTNNWITPLFIKAYRDNTIISIKSINPFYLYSKRI